MSAVAKAGFRPLHEAHAIEAVVVNIQFPVALDDHAFKSVMAAFDQHGDHLGVRQVLRSMGFQIGPQGVTHMNPQGGALPEGLSRHRTDSKGAQIEEARIDRQSFVYVSQDYSGWNEFIKNVFLILIPILNAIEEKNRDAQINLVGLTYVDRFHYAGGMSDYKISSLIKEDCPFVSSYVKEASDLWHCHSGMFAEGVFGLKELTSVRVDCLDEPFEDDFAPSRRRVVRIENTVNLILDAASNYSSVAYIIGDSDKLFNSMHARQREIIKLTLKDSILEEIGMNYE